MRTPKTENKHLKWVILSLVFDISLSLGLGVAYHRQAQDTHNACQAVNTTNKGMLDFFNAELKGVPAPTAPPANATQAQKDDYAKAIEARQTLDNNLVKYFGHRDC